jgi:hypothetical protein
MTTAAIYKLYKDTSEGRTHRRIAVTEGTDGTFVLIVTEVYSNNSTDPEGDDPAMSTGKAVGEVEVHPTVEEANARAKEIFDENVEDGFVDIPDATKRT